MKYICIQKEHRIMDHFILHQKRCWAEIFQRTGQSSLQFKMQTTSSVLNKVVLYSKWGHKCSYYDRDNKNIEQYTTTELYLIFIDIHNSFYSDFLMILPINQVRIIILILILYLKCNTIKCYGEIRFTHNNVPFQDSRLILSRS